MEDLQPSPFGGGPEAASQEDGVTETCQDRPGPTLLPSGKAEPLLNRSWTSTWKCWLETLHPQKYWLPGGLQMASDKERAKLSPGFAHVGSWVFSFDKVEGRGKRRKKKKSKEETLSSPIWTWLSDQTTTTPRYLTWSPGGFATVASGNFNSTTSSTAVCFLFVFVLPKGPQALDFSGLGAKLDSTQGLAIWKV